MQVSTTSTFLFALLPLSLGSGASAVTTQQDAPQRGGWDEARQGPLPRWREGVTPDDPNQSLSPYAIHALPRMHLPEMAPGTGTIASPPEYAPCAGVIFRYSSGSWAQVVVDCVAALTGAAAHDEIAWVVVASEAQKASATAAFAAAGADLGKVRFLFEPTNSIWLRDYGPHFIWQADTLGIADSHYYPTRPEDNFIPTLVAEHEFVVPAYPMGLYYSGGNFQPGPARTGFLTSLINLDNPEMSAAQIAELYSDYQGIDTVHVMPKLPSSVDATGHIDMWMYLVDEDSVIISQFKPGSNATAISITDNAVPYMRELGFTVHRPPAWNVGSTHYTYANAFRVNDRIFVPIYGPGNAAYLADDQAALAVWTAAAGPGVTIVPINCYSIIPAAGAIHCIMMQVPKVVASTPAVHVLAPSGGELLAQGKTYDLTWSASDDEQVRLIDLYLSYDGALGPPHLISAGEVDDGHFAWTVPNGLLALPDGALTLDAHVRVVAEDNVGFSSMAESEASFQIARARQHVYDFGQGAGVDKWAYGNQTTSWTQLSGIRSPTALGTPLDANAYSALASSDASGGDGDPARYVSPIPANGSESTHLFDFMIAENPGCLLDLEIAWEGYGDDCLQVELYVWDNVASNWSDARGAFGLNAYAANWAGNRDERLVTHIRSDFTRYIDATGRLSFLVYAERASQETFHDYVSVTTTFKNCP